MGKNLPHYVAGIDPRPKNSMNGTLRWVLVALVVLGAGVLITTFALDNLIQQDIGKTNADLVSHVNIMNISNNVVSIGLQTYNEISQYKLDGTGTLMFIPKGFSGER